MVWDAELAVLDLQYAWMWSNVWHANDKRQKFQFLESDIDKQIWKANGSQSKPVLLFNP